MEKAFHPRGNAGLKFSPGDDRIVDWCEAAVTPPGGDAEQPEAPQQRFLRQLEVRKPSPNDSWIVHAWRLHLEQEDQVVEHVLLSTTRG